MLVEALRGLWYRPPSHKQWEQGAEQPLGSMLWGLDHELGVDEVNKGSFCSHRPRNLAKVKYLLGKACTAQKNKSFSDTKGIQYKPRGAGRAWGSWGSVPSSC